MKTYRVTVNGEIYDVTVEEVHPGVLPSRRTVPVPAPAPVPVAAPAPVAAAPAPKPAPVTPAPAPTLVPGTASGGTEIQAPMPGKVLAMKVSAGKVVKSGEVLAILEAMKMENDIVAPVDGTIQSINVNVGDSVNTGDVLIVIN
jgi:biotin carboxyl carrier protein